MYVGRYPTTEKDSVQFCYVKDKVVLFNYPLNTG